MGIGLIRFEPERKESPETSLDAVSFLIVS